MIQIVGVSRRYAVALLAAGAACGGALFAQAPAMGTALAVQGSEAGMAGMQAAGSATKTSSTQAVTLVQALNLARANEPTFAAAYAASRVAKLDKSIARSSLLPSVVYHNQYLFTESNHVPLSQTAAAGSEPTTNQTAPVFIANNGVHEYVSQAVVNETIGLTQINAVARADAASAVAAAELEISRRGLAATVVGMFYSASVSEGKSAIARRALHEAQDFVKQTQQREAER